MSLIDTVLRRAERGENAAVYRLTARDLEDSEYRWIRVQEKKKKGGAPAEMLIFH